MTPNGAYSVLRYFRSWNAGLLQHGASNLLSRKLRGNPPIDIQAQTQDIVSPDDEDDIAVIDG